jgi:ABC-type transport system involved in multi-copper enzyme maturation permease subunit
MSADEMPGGTGGWLPQLTSQAKPAEATGGPVSPGPPTHQTAADPSAAGPTTAGEATARQATGVRPRLDWQDVRLPAGVNPVPAWLRFFNSELRLVFGRPRNLALLGVLAIVPVFLGVLLRVTVASSGGPGGPAFLNQLAGNGVFLALVVLTLTLSVLLLPLSIGVVSGDAVAGEAGHGTLRGLLTVPSGRTRLLAVKYAAIVVFSLAACLLVTAVSLIMGLILFPAGPVTLLSGTTVSLGAGVLRVLMVALFAAGAMASLGAIGLAASTMTQHPVGAIAGVLIITVASEICDQLPQLSAIHSYLPTHYWLSWDGLFGSPVDWSGVEHGLVSFGLYAVIFGAIAWAKLTSADITT